MNFMNNLRLFAESVTNSAEVISKLKNVFNDVLLQEKFSLKVES